MSARPATPSPAPHVRKAQGADLPREHGIKRHGGHHYEIDHLIPLGLGGADVRENLWPESFDTKPWNAADKNLLEERLHEAVCAGRVPLEQAQRDIAADWIAAYQRYIGERWQ